MLSQVWNVHFSVRSMEHSRLYTRSLSSPSYPPSYTTLLFPCIARFYEVQHV